ncbi:MAG: HU family DNA-binding protein [Actinobacteria bacterium]|nr:HU family DNA-binding protein [Actinomycetota bacterium]
MNKAELIDAVASRLDGSKKAAADAVEAFIDTIAAAVAKGDKVSITGFGTFSKSDRPARTGRNPQTGAPVKIKATSVPKFKAGAEFKAIVSGKKKAAAAKPAAKKAAKPVAKKATAKKVAKPAAKKAAAKKAPAKKAAKKR